MADVVAQGMKSLGQDLEMEGANAEKIQSDMKPGSMSPAMGEP